MVFFFVWIPKSKKFFSWFSFKIQVQVSPLLNQWQAKNFNLFSERIPWLLKLGKKSKERSFTVEIEVGECIGGFVDRRLEAPEIFPAVARERENVGGDGDRDQDSGELRRRDEQSY